MLPCVCASVSESEELIETMLCVVPEGLWQNVKRSVCSVWWNESYYWCVELSGEEAAVPSTGIAGSVWKRLQTCVCTGGLVCFYGVAGAFAANIVLVGATRIAFKLAKAAGQHFSPQNSWFLRLANHPQKCQINSNLEFHNLSKERWDTRLHVVMKEAEDYKVTRFKQHLLRNEPGCS